MSKDELHAADVRLAFDRIAPAFESRFENETTARMRELVYTTITSLLPARAAILDLNCGIGIDAIELARRGYDVTGVDLSPGMIREARKRAEDSSPFRPTFLVSSFDDLSVLGERTFDLVLSNFGGLNCTDSPAEVFRNAAEHLRPGGMFLAVLMPQVSLWEILAGVSRFSGKSAFRRFQKNVQATGFAGRTFRVFYHSLRHTLRQAFPWFTPVTIRGLWVLSPPPHADTFRRKWPLLSAWLTRLDDHIAHLPLFRAAGDHTMILFTRTSVPARRESPDIDLEIGQFRTGRYQWDHDPSFEKTVRDKRVALVGPAGSLVGTRQGSFIDSFDVVVRMNDVFTLDWGRFRSDYGSRTDILYCNQSILANILNRSEMAARFAQAARGWGLKHVVCTNNSLDFDAAGNPSGQCPQAHRHLRRRFVRFLEAEGLATRFRMVYAASSLLKRWLSGDWGRTGFVAIMDLLGFPLGQLSITGMTFYHAGGHIVSDGPELHPLRNRDGTSTLHEGYGHNSYKEVALLRRLSKAFGPVMDLDRTLAGIVEISASGNH